MDHASKARDYLRTAESASPEMINDVRAEAQISALIAIAHALLAISEHLPAVRETLQGIRADIIEARP